MLHACLVDDPSLKSPQFLDHISFEDETDPSGKALEAIKSFNERKVACLARGALLWFDGRPERFEYIAEDSILRERLGEMAKMDGTITCMSGRTYKYFGQCFGWIPGSRAYWKGWLYTADKKFIFDDIRTSKDQLAMFAGEMLNMPLDIGTVKALAENALLNDVEEWDSKREPE
jgi:hypothetical protein